MQEEKDVARGAGGAQIHLSGTTRGTGEENVCGASDFAGRILAAAVDHDDLMWALISEQSQCLGQTSGFIQSGNNDRDTHQALDTSSQRRRTCSRFAVPVVPIC